MEPDEPAKKAQYLERLIMGLEQVQESLQMEIPFYKADDIQGRYAKKYLTSVTEHLAQTRAQLDELRKSLPASKPESH